MTKNQQEVMLEIFALLYTAAECRFSCCQFQINLSNPWQILFTSQRFNVPSCKQHLAGKKSFLLLIFALVIILFCRVRIQLLYRNK